MFKTIVFDLDGTICHHKASYPKMFFEIFGEQFNKHSDTWLRHMLHNGEHTGLEAVQSCFPEMSPEEQKNALDTFTYRWSEAQVPFTGIFEAMALLKANFGCQIGVMTNGPSQFQWAVMNKLGLSEHVDFAYASGDPFPAECKPSIPLLRKLQSQRNFEADTALFIGDNLEKDIKPAREAGWSALHVAPHDDKTVPLPLSDFTKAAKQDSLLKVNWSSLTA
ncbi:HAD family hydrolase [Pseudovibrio brasiliensis]|uniref:phosphoglycolate phosphatase n=1 Tax=Pseudovibrio brasiliensis TaxID=1898042 RepID=A0ABX8AM27_9HYPH|nr:HAD family hydrolase [Pseudovibrio brasiliensis]QUS54711.1 HAD family hydrolase [Pseudovibrio brasiliensis]